MIKVRNRSKILEGKRRIERTRVAEGRIEEETF